jgi:hypothetical protein
MKRIISALTSLIFCLALFSQTPSLYQKGVTAEKNLIDVLAVAPYSTGGMGFDNRYEGVRGSPRLYDTLCLSHVLLKGESKYIVTKGDLDIDKRVMIFIHPRSGALMSLPAKEIAEVIINAGGNEKIYRTIHGSRLDKPVNTVFFYEHLVQSRFQLIRIPEKSLVESDFKSAYSAGRRYDEYKFGEKYYVMAADSVFRQIQLNRKSLVKALPGEKEKIAKLASGSAFSSQLEMVISILEGLK